MVSAKRLLTIPGPSAPEIATANSTDGNLNNFQAEIRNP